MGEAQNSMIRFGTPIAIRAASDITKTAVIASGSMALALDQKDSTPLVVGLLDYRWRTPGATGGPWVDYEPLPGLHLEILKPGMLKCGPYLLADGRIERLWHKTEIFGEFPQEKWRWESFSAVHVVKPSKYCSHQVGVDLLRTIWVRTWPVLLRTIRTQGHGGMLVLIPENQRSATAGRPIYNFNFGCLVKRVSEAIYARHLVPEGEVDAMQLRWEIARRELLAAIGTLARLTEMDGAVVLTHSLDVVATGVRLVPGSHNLSYSKDASPHSPPGPHEFAKSHGTRHNSAMDFCATNPDTTAVVISQDGGISLAASTRSVWTLITPPVA